MVVGSRRDFVLGLGVMLSGCGGPPSMPASAPSPLSGKPLPRINRRTLGGDSLDSQALGGRVIVVKFFAEYCAPCKKTLPAAEALSREHREVAFIGVSEDERASTAAELVQRYALSFPVIHDAGQVLSGRFRVNEMPATFVAGRDGVVCWVGGENQSEDALRDAIVAATR